LLAQPAASRIAQRAEETWIGKMREGNFRRDKGTLRNCFSA